MTTTAAKFSVAIEATEGRIRQAQRTLQRDLDTLDSIVESVREALANDDTRNLFWWANHTQGLSSTGALVERTLAELLTLNSQAAIIKNLEG